MGSTKDLFHALQRRAVSVGDQENTPSLNLGGHPTSHGGQLALPIKKQP